MDKRAESCGGKTAPPLHQREFHLKSADERPFTLNLALCAKRLSHHIGLPRLFDVVRGDDDGHSARLHDLHQVMPDPGEEEEEEEEMETREMLGSASP